MIGGTDKIFRVLDSGTALERATKALFRHWPDAVVEDALTGRTWRRIADVPFGKLTEVFVYQSSEHAARWDSEGAVDDLKTTMVQVLRSQRELTVVADDFSRPELQELSSFLSLSAIGILEHTQPRLLRAA